MPLGVRDHVVTANTPRVAATQLDVLDLELPEGQVISEHVELGQERSAGLVDFWQIIETFKRALKKLIGIYKRIN